MLEFSTAERKLQSALSIERYIHTMGVVKTAKSLLSTTEQMLKKLPMRPFFTIVQRIIQVK